MIKRTITVLSLVCLALGIHAESKYLTVEMKEGAKVSFLLADNPVITYQSGSLVVNKDAKTTYAFESVKNYHFTENNEGSSGGTTKVEANSSRPLQIVWIDNERFSFLPPSEVSSRESCWRCPVSLVRPLH